MKVSRFDGGLSAAFLAGIRRSTDMRVTVGTKVRYGCET